MRLPVLNKWSAGDQQDASMFNEISYALEFAMAPPQAWVVKTSSQSIPLNTFTAVNLSSIVRDTGAAAGDPPVWTASDPAKLYPQTPGWYDIEANVDWTSSTDNTRRILGIRHNSGGTNTIRTRQDILARGAMRQRLTVTWFINLGESIEMDVFTSAATTLAPTDPGQNSLRTGIRLRWFSL